MGGYLDRIKERLPSKEEAKARVQDIGKQAFLTGTVELPDNKYIFAFKVIKQTILFIYFLIQLVYPVIITALEQEYFGYNITCSVISFLGLLSQFLDIPDLLKTCKKLFKCCRRKCQYEVEKEEVELCDCCKADRCKKCSKWLSCITNFMSDNLVFPSVICNLIGFINERTWELKTGLDYFDMFLFVLGIFTDLVLIKGKSIWKYLVFRYIVRETLKEKGKKANDCLCCDIYNITFVYSILREIMHIAMFGMVSCKLYADNFAVENEYSKSKEPEEGSYRIEGFTWYAIIATWYMPTLSFIYFMFINLFVFYRSAFLLTNKDELDVNVNCELKYCFCIRNPCAIALIYLVLPTYVLFNFAAATQYDVVPDTLSSAWAILQIIFNITFIVAHIQAVGFHCLCCQCPCVYCFICCCTKFGQPYYDQDLKVQTNSKVV